MKASLTAFPKLTLSVLFACLLSLASGLVVGQPTKDDKALAAELYERAAASYKEGEYETAIGYLEQAYSLDPDPVILYNLGRSFEGNAQLDKAEAALLKVQADAKTPEEVQVRVTADLKRISNLKNNQLGELSIQSNPQGARLSLDDRNVGKTPYSDKVAIGEHAVLLQLDGYQSVETVAVVGKNTPTQLNLELRSLGRELSGLEIASYVALGVGSVGLIGGLVTYFPAAAASDDLNTAVDEGKWDVAKKAKSDGKLWSTVSTASYAVGFVGLGVGAGLLTYALLSGPSSEDAASWAPDAVAVDPLNGAVSMGWRW